MFRLSVWRKVWKLYVEWWNNIASPNAKALWILSCVNFLIPLIRFLIPVEWAKDVFLAVIVCVDLYFMLKVHREMKEMFDDIEFIEKLAED